MKLLFIIIFFATQVVMGCPTGIPGSSQSLPNHITVIYPEA